MKALIFALLMLSQTVFAVEKAGYYRVWAGYKLADLSQDQFQAKLPDFMSGISVYGDVLNQYIVAVPPENKPEGMPDEFALVALQDEASYRAVRETEAGMEYGESHWLLFDRETSKSAQLKTELPEVLVSGEAYDLSGGPINWRNGYTTFFIGLRKKEMSSDKFLARLKEHVSLTRATFRTPIGGYIVLANKDYEVAYINWKSKQAMDDALASDDGQFLFKDASDLMDFLQWGEAQVYEGSIAPGQAYKTK
jgi:hypothetical protein